jgi:hypothetical protein
LNRGLVFIKAGGYREAGVPTTYGIKLEVLRSLVYGTSAQTSAQTEDDLGTNEAEPRHNSQGTSAQSSPNLGTGADKFFRSSEESSRREVKPSPSFSNSKTGGQAKAVRSVAVSLAEVKNWAWDVSRTALFSPKSDNLISAWLQSHQDVDRPSLQKTVRSIVDGLDDFGLKTCGNTVASNLGRAEHDAKSDADYASEQARQEQWADEQIAEQRRKSEEEDRLREERSSTPSPTAEEMFGSPEPE